MASSWIASNELAWTEDLLADPAAYEAEVAGYVDLIQRNSSPNAGSLPHPGCGADGQDGVFQRHFAVTGVDLSRGMLDKARLRHPDVEYIEGDMRTVRPGRQFDAVAVPDSIDYISSLTELRMLPPSAKPGPGMSPGAFRSVPPGPTQRGASRARPAAGSPDPPA